MFKKTVSRFAALWQRRFFYLSTRFGAQVPVHNISWVPDGFRMQAIGRTGLRLVDNFCTPAEATQLIESASAALGAAGGDTLVCDARGSAGLNLRGVKADDAALLPLLYRASILFGLPYTHVEKLVLTRTTRTSDHDPVSQHTPTYAGEPRHAALLFLNDVADDAGGQTVFEGVHVSVSPRAGRAVCWTLGGVRSGRDLGVHEISPQAEDAEKWALQIWFGARPLRADIYGAANPPQSRQGKALEQGVAAPDGVWAPQDIDLEAVFGQPDKMKGLI